MEQDLRTRLFSSFFRIKKGILTLHADTPLNFTEFIALKKLHEDDHHTDLPTHLHINKSAISQMMSTLERKGMITRKTNVADRRKQDISLTEVGLKRLQETESYHTQTVNAALTHMSADRAKLLVELLEEFTTTIDAVSKPINRKDF